MSGAVAPERSRSPVPLLAAQGLTLGLLSGFIIIPAAGLFLARYGSRGLPLVYIVVAFVGAAVTPGLSNALRRWSLASVMVPLLSIVVVLITGVWIGIEVAHAVWLSFVLQVLFPMVLQLGFTFIGGQAGRLLTVRQMKEQFPRIVTGFAVGFLAAGLVGPPLLSLLGSTERLLGLASLSATMLLVLVLATRRQFPTELSHVERSTDDAPAVPLRSLLGRPFVFLLLSYQVLSQLGTQLVDFLVYDRAAARYATSAQLARFTSVFTVALNAADIVFLALFAGWLLRRYGMRLGLVANPAVVTALVVIGLVSGGAMGVGSLAVFMAFASGRISDITLTDGATRTAINTAYQALPAHERLAVQAGVEGIGIPGAIGVTGVVLLVVDRLFHGGVMAVAGVAAVAGVLWTVSGLAVYRGYQRNLRENLARRVLQPAELDLDDEASDEVVQRLLDGDEVDAGLALELIEAQHDGAARLAVVASTRSHPVAVRVAALDRLTAADPVQARFVAESLMLDPSPIIHSRADHLLADLRGSATAVDIRAQLQSVDPDEQAEAYRRAAAAVVADPSLSALVVAGLGSASTASMAAEALGRHHPRFGELLDAGLSDPDAADRDVIRLVRCASRSTDASVIEVLSRHAQHRSRDVGLEVLQALVRRAPQGEERWSALVSGIIHDDAAFAVRCRRALQTLDGRPGADELRRSIDDELTLLRRRTLAALGLLVGGPTVVQARAWLEGSDGRAAALALEALEVSMPADLRGDAMTLLETGSGSADDVGVVDPGVLEDLLHDPDDAWRRPWLRACAASLRG